MYTFPGWMFLSCIFKIKVRLEFKTKGLLCIFVTLATSFPFSWNQWPGTWTASLQSRLLLPPAQVIAQEGEARKQKGNCFRGKGRSSRNSTGRCCMCPVLHDVCYQSLQVGWEWDPQTWPCSWIPAQPLGAAEVGPSSSSAFLTWAAIRMCCRLSLRCVPAHGEGASCSAKNKNYHFKIVLKIS